MIAALNNNLKYEVYCQHRIEGKQKVYSKKHTYSMSNNFRSKFRDFGIQSNTTMSSGVSSAANVMSLQQSMGFNVAFNHISKDVDKTETTKTNTVESSQEYQVGHQQEWRTCEITVNIQGEEYTSTTEEQVYNYGPNEEKPSYQQLLERARNFINTNFLPAGHEPLTTGTKLQIFVPIKKLDKRNDGWLSQSNRLIESGDLGTWRKSTMCPRDHYVTGFNVKQREHASSGWYLGVGYPGDDKAMTDISIHCREIQGRSADKKAYVSSRIRTLKSYEGTGTGKWFNNYMCKDDSFVFGLNPRYDDYVLAKDNTGLNGIKARCGNAGYMPEWDNQHDVVEELEPKAEIFGDWKGYSNCPPNQLMCGIQVRVQAYQGKFVDDSGMTGLYMICCNVPWDQSSADE